MASSLELPRTTSTYCPLVGSAPDIEASEEEGALDEVKEETTSENYSKLESWIIALEKSDMKNVPGIVQRGSSNGGDWEINQEHPWVFQVEAVAKRIDKLYDSLKEKETQDEDGTAKYREIVQLKARVSKLQQEIRGHLPDVCCPRSAWRQAGAVGLAILGIGGFITGMVFLFKSMPDEKEKG